MNDFEHASMFHVIFAHHARQSVISTMTLSKSPRWALLVRRTRGLASHGSDSSERLTKGIAQNQIIHEGPTAKHLARGPGSAWGTRRDLVSGRCGEGEQEIGCQGWDTGMQPGDNGDRH
jgi:hypothetical protein